MLTRSPAARAACSASRVVSAAEGLRAGVMPVTWNQRQPRKADAHGTIPGRTPAAADPLRSYSTLLARGAAPNSRKYRPTRSSPVHTTWSVETPASRAWLAISRPRGLFVSRDTHAADRPSRATPTAVFSSAPPTCTSRLRACSSRRKLGGLRRTIASPKVTTSCGMLLPPGWDGVRAGAALPLSYGGGAASVPRGLGGWKRRASGGRRTAPGRPRPRRGRRRDLRRVGHLLDPVEPPLAVAALGLVEELHVVHLLQGVADLLDRLQGGGVVLHGPRAAGHATEGVQPLDALRRRVAVRQRRVHLPRLLVLLQRLLVLHRQEELALGRGEPGLPQHLLLLGREHRPLAQQLGQLVVPFDGAGQAQAVLLQVVLLCPLVLGDAREGILDRKSTR